MVGVSVLKEVLAKLFVGFQALTLFVWSVRTVAVLLRALVIALRAFVVIDASPLEAVDDAVDRAFHFAVFISVFNS